MFDRTQWNLINGKNWLGWFWWSNLYYSYIKILIYNDINDIDDII